jgi:hypothetical protein
MEKEEHRSKARSDMREKSNMLVIAAIQCSEANNVFRRFMTFDVFRSIQSCAHDACIEERELSSFFSWKEKKMLIVDTKD